MGSFIEVAKSCRRRDSFTRSSIIKYQTNIPIVVDDSDFGVVGGMDLETRAMFHMLVGMGFGDSDVF